RTGALRALREPRVRLSILLSRPDRQAPLVRLGDGDRALGVSARAPRSSLRPAVITRLPTAGFLAREASGFAARQTRGVFWRKPEACNLTPRGAGPRIRPLPNVSPADPLARKPVAPLLFGAVQASGSRQLGDRALSDRRREDAVRARR